MRLRYADEGGGSGLSKTPLHVAGADARIDKDRYCAALKSAKVMANSSGEGGTSRAVRTPLEIPILSKPAASLLLQWSSSRKVRVLCCSGKMIAAVSGCSCSHLGERAGDIYKAFRGHKENKPEKLFEPQRTPGTQRKAKIF